MRGIPIPPTSDLIKSFIKSDVGTEIDLTTGRIKNQIWGIEMDKMVSLKQYCEQHDIDVKHARRLARAGKFGDAIKMFDTVWVCPSDMDIPAIPETGTRGRKRADGRSRYVVYVADNAERDAIANIVGSDNVVDPRTLARERRAAAKLAASESAERERIDADE